MRFADILIDLASVATASRSVASKHVQLRAGQLDRYGQTSSIVRSWRDQRQPSSRPAPESDTGVEPDHGQDSSVSTTEEASIPKESDATGHGPPQPSEFSAAPRSPLDIPSIRTAPFQGTDPGSVLSKQPEQGAILTQLREAAEKQNVEPKESVTDEDVPEGIDINIFHTAQGSQIIDKTKSTTGPKRGVKVPPSPGWFKDFGHDQAQSAQVETQTELKTPESTPDGPADEKGAQTLLESTAQQSAVESLSTSTPPDEIYARSHEVEKEHTRMVEEILSNSEQAKPEQTGPGPAPSSIVIEEPAVPRHELRESRVPSTRLGRLWGYGGLAAGMLGGAITESVSRGFGGSGQGSVLMSSSNMERLVAKLSRMRGAALKMGQMMSFQDSKMLPAPIQQVLQRVQDRADYMPAWQRDRVLTANLGSEWRELFDEFDEKPMAAASIGQVHRATLKSNGQRVAVKIQFPGVADSINSDLDNLSMLLTASRMLPKGLYLDKTIQNARTELAWECDYEREAAYSQRYREILKDETDIFTVPEVFLEASGKQVLTMEYLDGVGVTRIDSFTQEQRDWIGTQLLRLSLREITEFRLMQTDPNWTNFLYNAETNRLELLDFGASREFPEEFVTQYVSLLAAAARSDREAVKTLSESLGYLTGHESKMMLDAHIASIMTLSEPFLSTAPEVYDFQDQTITERVKALIPVMLRERLSPPPEETYSLHRKLSGAFLLCARLGSKVPCRQLFEDALKKTDLNLIV